FQHVDIRKPLIPIDPELTLTLTIDKTCGCRTMCIKDDNALAFFLEVSQSVERYFVVTEGNENTYITVEQPLHIGRQYWIHAARLTFEPVIHIDEAQAADIALIVARRHTAKVNTAIAPEHLLDIVEVDLSDMSNRINPDAVSGERRQGNDRMSYTPPLLDQVAVVRHDVIARHRPNDGYLFHDSSFSCMNVH